MAQAANILNYKTACGIASDSTLHVNCVDSEEITAAWNYGANFGGPTKSTWTSGANSLTAGNSAATTGQGMFGRYGPCWRPCGAIDDIYKKECSTHGHTHGSPFYEKYQVTKDFPPGADEIRAMGHMKSSNS